MLKELSIFIILINLSLSLSVADGFKKVANILEQNCVKCHHEEKDKGGLMLKTLADIEAGGDSGPSLVINDPAKSELLARVKLDPDHDDIMPPKGDPLTSQQIKAIESWIKSGAFWPKGRVLKAPAEEKNKTIVKHSNDFARFHSDLNDEDFFRKEVFPILEAFSSCC